MTSPYEEEASALVAAESARSGGGRPIAIYASVRSTTRVADPLVGLGAPLVAYVLGSVDEEPERVTAVEGRHTASGETMGLDTEVEVWALLIRCRTGLTVTVDIGSGPWTTARGPVDLRVEWMGGERVIVLAPRGVEAVSQADGRRGLGLTGFEERLVEYAEELTDLMAEGEAPRELAVGLRVVEAGRESVRTGKPVALKGAGS